MAAHPQTNRPVRTNGGADVRENMSGPAPELALVTGPSPHHSTQPRSEMATILPPCPNPAQDKAAIHPLSRLDGCPECVLNTELPKSTAPTDDGYRAAYLCNDCGHAWTTDWTD